MLATYKKLQELVTEVAEDVNKSSAGNKAAGTRVRKRMQEVKAVATDLRNKSLELGKPKG